MSPLGSISHLNRVDWFYVIVATIFCAVAMVALLSLPFWKG